MEINKTSKYWGERLLQSLIVLLPTYLVRFEIAGIRLNVLDVVVVVSFLTCILLYRQARLGVLCMGIWKYIMGSFAIIGLIAVIISANTMAALGLYKSYIIAPMLVGIMVLTIRPRLEAILQAFALLIVFIGTIGIWQLLTGYGIPAPWNIPGDEFRITSVYDYPNAVGLTLAPLLALLAAHLLQRGTHKQWFLPIFLLGCLAVVWSRSDGAVVAVFAAVASCLLFTRWRWGVVFGSALMFIALLLFTPTREIILMQNTSGEVRLALWQGTANLLLHHPLTGAGLAGFPDLYAQYKLDRHVELLLYPHNIILDFWVELGLVGLLWLIFVVGRFGWRLLIVKNCPAIILLCGMVAILIYGLVDVPYFKNDLAIVFWIILTLADTTIHPTTN